MSDESADDKWIGLFMCSVAIAFAVIIVGSAWAGAYFDRVRATASVACIQAGGDWKNGVCGRGK